MPTSNVQDPFEYLIEDHKKIALLLAQAVSGPPAARERQFSEIKDALSLHMELEETAIYPVLKGREGTRTQAIEAKEEHRLMKALLAELSAISPKDDEWGKKLRLLKAEVERHVSEEEGSFFPKAKKELSREDGEMVRREMARFLGAPAARVRGLNAADEDPREAP